jgi:hypothetical protein
MNYSFFLFSKLFDIYHTNEEPYDILFEEVGKMYKDWLIWDVDNGKKIGEYESMQKYLATHTPESIQSTIVNH